LRGRAGRQGDPGSSRFYLSLEDDLMRIFGSGRIAGLMQRLGMEEGVPIEHGMVTKAIERAQKQVEAQNFATRKHLLEYDDVMNKQRENVYTLRRDILDGQIKVDEEEVLDSRAYVMTLAEEKIQAMVDQYAGEKQEPQEWDVDALQREASELFGIEPESVESLGLSEMSPDDMAEAIYRLAVSSYEEKEKLLPDPAILRRVERDFMLQIVDAQWKDHLYSLDHLKEGIGLRGYGQRDPLVEYKKESFNLFQSMKDRIDDEMVRYLWRLRPVMAEAQDGAAPAPVAPVRQPARKPSALSYSGGSETAGATTRQPSSAPPRPPRTGGDDAPIKTVRRDEPKLGRNDPCYCGSGKKYKKCHGANE
jgi:preprotein translocase subunit SecA